MFIGLALLFTTYFESHGSVFDLIQLTIVFASGMLIWVALASSVARRTAGVGRALVQVAAGIVALLFMFTWPSLIYSILHPY